MVGRTGGGDVRGGAAGLLAIADQDKETVSLFCASSYAMAGAVGKWGVFHGHGSENEFVMVERARVRSFVACEIRFMFVRDDTELCAAKLFPT